MEFTTKKNPNYQNRQRQLVDMINMNGPDFLIYQFAVNMLESMFGFSVWKLISYIAWRELKLKWICFMGRFKKDPFDKYLDQNKLDINKNNGGMEWKQYKHYLQSFYL
jgi:hypothetical protein